MIRSTTKNKRFKKILTQAAVAIFWVLVWQLVYALVAREVLLVSPVQAAKRLFSIAAERAFWQSVNLTVLRVVSGFALAVAVGTLLAAATARWTMLHRLFSPVLNVVRATPVASFIILALVWMTKNRVPIFIVFLMVLPAVWANLYTGIIQTDQSLLEMAAVFRFSRTKKLGHIYVPSVLPYFTAACSSGLGFAWKSAIAAEVIALPRASIGREIYNAKIYLETADLFAWTIAVIVLSVIIEKLTMRVLGLLGKRLAKF